MVNFIILELKFKVLKNYSAFFFVSLSPKRKSERIEGISFPQNLNLFPRNPLQGFDEKFENVPDTWWKIRHKVVENRSCEVPEPLRPQDHQNVRPIWSKASLVPSLTRSMRGWEETEAAPGIRSKWLASKLSLTLGEFS